MCKMTAFRCIYKPLGLTCVVGCSVIVMVFAIRYLSSQKTIHFIQSTYDRTESTRDLNAFQIQRPTPSFDENDTSNVIHSSYFNGIEDIMSMKPPTLLKNYKNPCWLETRTTGVGSIKKIRCLPYFHLAGVSKCGTTDSFHRITLHPSILRNTAIRGKETWFWARRRYGTDGDGKNGTKLTLYDFIDYFKAPETEAIVDENGYHSTITGHADPMDLWEETEWRKIPENAEQLAVPKIAKPTLIHHINPTVKVIFLLRDPVERIYSHYYQLRMGKTQKEFHDYVLKATTEAKECLKKFDVRTCKFKENRHRKILIWMGMYSVHLQEWFKVFPRNQILIVRSEDYMSNVTKELSHIFKFLDVEQLPAKDMAKIARGSIVNLSTYKKKVGPMLSETRDILHKFYLPYNKELAKMLNDPKYLWSSEK